MKKVILFCLVFLMVATSVFAVQPEAGWKSESSYGYQDGKGI